MTNINHFITVDLGASSGRVTLISIGNNIQQQEVYRFKNQPSSEGDFLVWDFLSILNHIKAGIKQAFELEPNITSIGIDTWGCDYGYIDQAGKLIRNPICYRDTRTEGIDSFTKYYFSQSDLYKSTGIQHLRFNTIYQIACDLKYDKHLLEQVDTLLLMPDLIAYFLTGKKYMELTNLSTTSFYDPNHKEISPLLYELGFKQAWLAPLIHPKETYGVFSDEIVNELGIKPIEVVAVCTHDTASAIHSMTIEPEDVYISSGTWSLIGKLLDQPLINEDTYRASYTNEIGMNHQVRLLKNISGFFIKNKIIEAYDANMLDFDTLDEGIQSSLSFDSVIDLDHKDFELGEDILNTIKVHCIKTNQKAPSNLYEYLALFNYSLVSKYRYHLEILERLTETKTRQIIIMGGGSQNDLINQMTSDMTGITVKKGYKEASSVGNAFVQQQRLNERFNPNSLIHNQSQVFKPKHSYEPIYKKFLTIIKEGNL